MERRPGRPFLRRICGFVDLCARHARVHAHPHRASRVRVLVRHEGLWRSQLPPANQTPDRLRNELPSRTLGQLGARSCSLTLPASPLLDSVKAAVNVVTSGRKETPSAPQGRHATTLPIPGGSPCSHYVSACEQLSLACTAGSLAHRQLPPAPMAGAHTCLVTVPGASPR